MLILSENKEGNNMVCIVFPFVEKKDLIYINRAKTPECYHCLSLGDNIISDFHFLPFVFLYIEGFLQEAHV